MKYARKRGAIRPKDVVGMGISRHYLYRLAKGGQLIRTARGIYCPAAFEPTEYHSYVEVAVAIPKGVICLLSALQFHELTTQLPHRVWIAIDRKARRPRISLPVNIVRFSAETLAKGTGKYKIEGVTLQITNPAKTVADCFKYRNKIGLDVAIESLSDCVSQRKATRDEIWRYAKLCRVANVIRPYMEAMS
jgi:predicted transcriptional regulator of viral defense system